MITVDSAEFAQFHLYPRGPRRRRATPSPISPRVTARPIPRLAPVTMAVFPDSCRSMATVTGRRSQSSAVVATSGHPLSMVSEWPRSGKSMMSVTASECRYCASVARTTLSGTVWSLPPLIRSSGPRELLWVSTLVDACGLKFAAAASNSGRPGAGTVQRW